MKKLLVGLTFGALLLTGFAFADNSANDLAFEVEPSILSVQKTA
ncbi:hypothetical protein [Oceanobacillus zhaokaii]|nr:hypothetical protein [Oceanobacillus zhaokaii]